METRSSGESESPGGSAKSMQENSRPQPDFIAALGKVKRPFVVGHVTPDSDAIGAALGLAALLGEHGVAAVVGLSPGLVARKLRFMFELAPDVPLAERFAPGGEHDAIIVVDTAGAKRINIDPKPSLDGVMPIFNIDHHITNTDFGTHNWVDPHATSTSELVARLAGCLGWQMTPQVASLLYAGIHGDTGGFSLPSTSGAALHTAGDLVDAGADVSHIGERLCRSQEEPEFELLRRVYDHTTVTKDGRIAYSYITYEDMTESRCTADEIDDQVSIPRALKNVQIAMLFSEGEKGVVRVNLRGEGQVTVLEIAQVFGGGGHKQSAGVRLRGQAMPDVIRDVLAAAEAHLDAHEVK